MLNHISWAAFFITAAITFFLWYAFIGLKYHYNDITDFLSGKRKDQSEHLFEAEGASDFTERNAIEHVVPKGVFEEPALNDFEIIEELVERVKSLICEAIEKEMPKEGFLSFLEKLLKDYPILLNSQFRPSVNEFITSECEVQGLYPITDQEVESLWHMR